MSLGKFARVTDGPYANWGADDEVGQIVLANNGTLTLGQPLAIDVTQLGPDQNVPNNAALLPQCERLVATTSANAGPIFGIFTSISAGLVRGVTQSLVAGITTFTNNSGSNVTLTVAVRQLGWAYVYCGTAAIGQTGGNSILVGSSLITTAAQPWAIQGTAAIGTVVGTALGTAINTTEAGLLAGIQTPGLGAPVNPGVISVVPLSMVGITPNTLVLVDSQPSGVQEQVSVGSISYPTFSIAIANAHPAGFRITGPAINPVKNAVLISTVGAGKTYQGLVAAYVNIQA